MLYRTSLQNVKLTLNLWWTFYSLNFEVLVTLGQVWVEKLVTYCYFSKGMKISREIKIKVNN